MLPVLRSFYAAGKRLVKKFSHTKQGFSLIEVMITLTVISVGMLGIAGLQLAGMRYAHQANLRYQAALQGNNMAERINANRAGVALGAYNDLSGTPRDPGCSKTTCTPAQIAQLDAYEWNTGNAAVLPSGTGTIKGKGINSLFTITVTWMERGTTGSASVQRSYVIHLQI